MLRVVCGMLCITLAGCQTAKVALNENVTQLQGKTIVAAQHPDAGFYQKTMGSGMVIYGIGGVIGAAIGSAMEASGGNEMAREANLVDPANGLAVGLAQALAAKHGMQYLEPRPRTQASRMETLLKENKGADFVVDVRTIQWSVAPASFSEYSLVYTAEFKLFEAATRRPVAKGLCQSGHADPTDPPSRDELLANGGALLREFTAKAAARCVDEWAEQLLRVAPPALPATALPAAPAPAAPAQSAAASPPA